MTLSLPDRWIWDSWYVWEGELCHAFYLCASRGLGDPERRHRNVQIGHAVSRDLTSWTVLPDALTPSDQPGFDSWTTWTGSVVRHPRGEWWMFYTGTSREDNGQVQRIGAARSQDLMTWEKIPDLVVEADGQWYEKLSDQVWNDEAWRDPWVYFDDGDGAWHMLVTARSQSGLPDTRGAVGHAISQDLVKWEVTAPLSTSKTSFGHMEVFQWAEIDGVPVLIFCCGQRELGDEMRERFGNVDLSFSVACPGGLADIDFSQATPIPGDSLYAARAVQMPSGEWFVLGFHNQGPGGFVGELSDPVPVTASMKSGLVPR